MGPRFGYRQWHCQHPKLRFYFSPTTRSQRRGGWQKAKQIRKETVLKSRFIFSDPPRMSTGQLEVIARAAPASAGISWQRLAWRSLTQVLFRRPIGALTRVSHFRCHLEASDAISRLLLFDWPAVVRKTAARNLRPAALHNLLIRPVILCHRSQL